MYYTIRIYDEKDENILAEYQYICVEKNSFQVTLSEEEDNLIRIFISYFPFHQGKKRPVYILGGQCNNPEDIAKTITNGVNGLECDIWADEENNWWVNHSQQKEVSLEKWLIYAAKAHKNFPNQFALIIFDTKTAKSLEFLHNSSSKILSSSLNVIFSVSNIDKAVAFETIIPYLLPHQGLAIDEENNVDAVVEFFKSKNVNQFWYGNGIFSGGFDTANQHESLRKAGELRDSGSEIKKTYIWTIEDKETMISYLYDEKVDGLITNSGTNGRNYLSNALDIINSSHELRIATAEDNIFGIFKK